MRARSSFFVRRARSALAIALGSLVAQPFGCGTDTAESSGDATTTDAEATTHPSACEAPTPVVVAGQDTGFVRCANGATHRPAAVACADLTPRAAPCEHAPAMPPDVGCTKDADCTEPLSYCAVRGGTSPSDPSCVCTRGCTTDADCAGGICSAHASRPAAPPTRTAGRARCARA
jgi:hypothetical protein